MRSKEVTIFEWIIVFILLSIPFLNVIMIFIFALGNFNPSLKNFAKAILFIVIFGVLLLFIFYGSLDQLFRFNR